MIGRERSLAPVRLPSSAHTFLESLPEDMRDDDSIPLRIPTKYGTYVGRALAEWCVIVDEHEQFLFRRKNEGRPTDNDVETPSLGVEAGRKF